MDNWYNKLASKYGDQFCVEAGYFEETKPFDISYRDIFNFPVNKDVLQFSGAFHPFHEGHLSVIQDAIGNTAHEYESDFDPFVVIHADHSEYRHSKGTYAEEKFIDSFNLMNTLGVPWMLVREDAMPNSCSRNFTRLYEELQLVSRSVTFVCGGDRANFALTFMDEGRCIVAGRDQSPMFQKYEHLEKQPNIIFLPGHHPASSTAIRQ